MLSKQELGIGADDFSNTPAHPNHHNMQIQVLAPPNMSSCDFPAFVMVWLSYAMISCIKRDTLAQYTYVHIIKE